MRKANHPDDLDKLLRRVTTPELRGVLLIGICLRLREGKYKPWLKKPGCKQRSLNDWLKWLKEYRGGKKNGNLC